MITNIFVVLLRCNGTATTATAAKKKPRNRKEKKKKEGIRALHTHTQTHSERRHRKVAYVKKVVKYCGTKRSYHISIGVDAFKYSGFHK